LPNFGDKVVGQYERGEKKGLKGFFLGGGKGKKIKRRREIAKKNGKPETDGSVSPGGGEERGGGFTKKKGMVGARKNELENRPVGGLTPENYWLLRSRTRAKDRTINWGKNRRMISG